MSIFWFVVFLPLIFQSVKTETDLEMEVMQELNMLEDRVYMPINLYLSTLATAFETLASNFTNYQNEANSVVNSYSETIEDEASSILDTFNENGVDISTCEESFQDNLDQIIKTSTDDIKNVILEGVILGQKCITDAKNVYLVAQNKTIEVRLIVQNCLLLLDDTECLINALAKIVFMEQTISKVISTIGTQHESQLSLLEQSVISGLEKVVIEVFNSLMGILDDFAICAAQQEL